MMNTIKFRPTGNPKHKKITYQDIGSKSQLIDGAKVKARQLGISPKIRLFIQDSNETIIFNGVVTI